MRTPLKNISTGRYTAQQASAIYTGVSDSRNDPAPIISGTNTPDLVGFVPENLGEQHAVGFVFAILRKSHFGADDPRLVGVHIHGRKSAGEIDAGFGHENLFGGAEDMEFVGIDLGRENGGAVAEDVVVVRAFAAVAEALCFVSVF